MYVRELGVDWYLLSKVVTHTCLDEFSRSVSSLLYNKPNISSQGNVINLLEMYKHTRAYDDGSIHPSAQRWLIVESRRRYIRLFFLASKKIQQLSFASSSLPEGTLYLSYHSGLHARLFHPCRSGVKY